MWLVAFIACVYMCVCVCPLCCVVIVAVLVVFFFHLVFFFVCIHVLRAWLDNITELYLRAWLFFHSILMLLPIIPL